MPNVSSSETVYLAWRGASGYVLLATVADYHSQGNDVPEIERFVADGVSVEVRVRQEWFEPEFDQVPLVASTREIRVGRAPGGLFVSSWSGSERRIQRLNMATHELEDVLPGACG